MIRMFHDHSPNQHTRKQCEGEDGAVAGTLMDGEVRRVEEESEDGGGDDSCDGGEEGCESSCADGEVECEVGGGPTPVKPRGDYR